MIMQYASLALSIVALILAIYTSIYMYNEN